MIRIWLLNCLFVLMIFPLSGQTDYSVFSEKLCELSKEIALDDPEVALKKFQTISLIFNKLNDMKLTGLTLRLARKNPELKKEEVRQQIILKVMIESVRTCENYLTLSRSFLPPPPESNPVFEHVKEQMDNWINESKPSEEMVVDQAPVMMVDFAMSKKDEVPASYKEGVFDGQFMNDVTLYLMHHSDPYYKSLVIQSMVSQYDGLKLID